MGTGALVIRSSTLRKQFLRTDNTIVGGGLHVISRMSEALWCGVGSLWGPIKTARSTSLRGSLRISLPLLADRFVWPALFQDRVRRSELAGGALSVSDARDTPGGGFGHPSLSIAQMTSIELPSALRSGCQPPARPVCGGTPPRQGRGGGLGRAPQE